MRLCERVSVCEKACATLDPSAAALLARMASLSLEKASSNSFRTSLSRMVTSSPKVRQPPVINYRRGKGVIGCVNMYIDRIFSYSYGVLLIGDVNRFCLCRRTRLKSFF